MKKLIAFTITAALVAGPALAEARLQIDSGAASVNHGRGFAPASADTPLAPGDLVKVDAGGAARIVYGEQCSVTLAAGSVSRVGDAPCQQDAGEIPPEALALGGLAAVGAGAGVAVAVSRKGSGSNTPLIPPRTPCASAGC